MLERYHEAVLRAHKEHAGVETRIPVPVPPPPVDVTVGAGQRTGRTTGAPTRSALSPTTRRCVASAASTLDGKLSAMRLYNTLTREVDEVRPVIEGHVTIYTCGPTVYRYAHLGNMRTFMLGDLIRRGLELEGYEVTQIMNITDVGHMTDEASPEAVDKMVLAVEDEGMSPREIAEKYARAVFDDAAAVGIRPADRYPKATEHIPEMIELTQTLIDGGHAYVVDSGSVYFDVSSFPGYGKLSGNTLDNLREGHRDLETDPAKRNPADFALWKAAGPGRLMKWDSPWGEGFPGWHIECSAMSMKYLGERIDIHTGGNDLRFPHHEDEIAQTESVVGHQVVSIWVHGGHLRQTGQKISKSTGNTVGVSDLLERGLDPLAFRWLTFQTRYRSEMDFTWGAMEAADAKVKQLRRRMAAWGPGTELPRTARSAVRRGPTTLGSVRPWRRTSTCLRRSWS